MSFDWNLSSDEEESGFADWANVDLKASLGASKSNGNESDSENDEDKKPAAVTYEFGGGDFDGAFGGGAASDDEDGVNWEDADEDLPDGLAFANDAGANSNNTSRTDANSKLPPNTNVPQIKITALRPITLDLNKDPKSKDDDARPKKRARRSYRFDHLPRGMKEFITTLQKTHLLCLTATALHVSTYCSDALFQCLAYSLIPQKWTTISMPTLKQLADFSRWFFDLVNNAEMRRRQISETHARAGLPRARHQPRSRKSPTTQRIPPQDTLEIRYRGPAYCTYLARSLDDNPNLQDIPMPNPPWSEHDKVQLFVAMTRALKWRSRFVMALEPIKGDLDVNHPVMIQEHLQNFFSKLQKAKSKTQKLFSNTGAKKTPIDVDGADDAAIEQSHPIKSVVWAEVLCDPSKKVKKADTNGTIASTSTSTQKMKWVHIDPAYQFINQPTKVESVLYTLRQDIQSNQAGGRGRTNLSSRTQPIGYALAVEHRETDGIAPDLMVRLLDVTPRYASSYIESLKVIGVLRGKQTRVKEQEQVNKWWSNMLKSMSSKKVKAEAQEQQVMLNLHQTGVDVSDAIDISDSPKSVSPKEDVVDDEMSADEYEENELSEQAKQEPLPTSKQGFKSHPVYVLPSILSAAEMLMPDAKKRVCGVFKGELVYRRFDVTTLLPASKWLYKARKVKRLELKKPMKRIKARKKAAPSGFKALRSYGVGKGNDGTEERRLKEIERASKPLEDGMEDVYAIWQTEPWSPPPVGPNDRIPVNDFRNVELDLMNPGLVHVDEPSIEKVAQQLGVRYAPCLVGFDGRGGNRTATLRGIVVHAHNEALLREAHVEVASHLIETSHEEHQRKVYARWKRLLVGVLTKDRLDREYGE